MSEIVFAGSKLIYERQWHDCLFVIGEKKMHLVVEAEGSKIIRHFPTSNKDIDVWNSLTNEQRITDIPSIFRDEFEK